MTQRLVNCRLFSSDKYLLSSARTWFTDFPSSISLSLSLSPPTSHFCLFPLLLLSGGVDLSIRTGSPSASIRLRKWPNYCDDPRADNRPPSVSSQLAASKFRKRNAIWAPASNLRSSNFMARRWWRDRPPINSHPFPPPWAFPLISALVQIFNRNRI